MKRRDRQLKVLARCDAAIAAQKRNDELAAELQRTINATVAKMSVENTKPQVDVLAANAFTTFVFTPMTARAKDWFDEHVESEPWQWLGASMVVETRFAWGLAEGMIADGLVLQ